MPQSFLNSASLHVLPSGLLGFVLTKSQGSFEIIKKNIRIFRYHYTVVDTL